jgi:hypothetical protein
VGRDGKYHYDSGRARCSRFKDRAQLKFDYMLIDDFWGTEEQPLRQQDHAIPVRFGAGKLADHLSDSGIATALLNGGLAGAGQPEQELAVNDFFDGDLFDLLAVENTATETRVEQVQPIIPGAAGRAASDAGRPASSPRVVFTSNDVRTETFTFRGVLQGFMMGVGACGAILLILRLVS